jgi:hypothetical protein
LYQIPYYYSKRTDAYNYENKSGYAVIATILTTTILSLGLLGNVQAQNTTAPQQQQQTANPEQIKTYLTEAIQAIDSGNNTQALERVDLAGDQLEMLTGTQSVDDDDEDEDEGEIEEGAGEDADEAGDVDTNDEEDTP